MAGEADFFWDLLSDVWDDYEDKDRHAYAWEAYLQIASDLLLQMLQANLSKSLIDIPTFRRYRWKNYQLTRTVRPTTCQCDKLFAYDAGDVDVVSIPNLQDLVRGPFDDEYRQVTRRLTGMTVNGNQLQDFVYPFPADVRVGDFVRMVSGTGLADYDKGVRFQIVLIDNANTLTLAVSNLSTASSIEYEIERSPAVELIEGTHYTVSAGKLNFAPAAVLSQDGSVTAFRAVEHLEYSGDFVRDDPRLIADGGNGVTTGTGDISVGSSMLTDGAALFLTNPTVAERPVAGDYLVLRPSGVQPSQILTTQQVYKIAAVVSDTQLAFAGVSPTTTVSVTYVVLKPSAEDFDLVSTEDGIAGYSLGYAFTTVAAAAPSGTTGEFIAVDQFQDTSRDFSGLVGKRLRVLSGSGLVPSELAAFTITEILNSPANDTVRVDRNVTALSSSPDAEYIVGDLLAVDVVDTRPSTGALLPDAFRFTATSTNTTSITDGSVFFNKDLAPVAGPLIKSIRDRDASSTSSMPSVPQLWAEETISDHTALYDNFGFPIQVQQVNSVEYKNVLQGLWFAYWSGPGIDNLVRGLNLVFNLPFAPNGGVISAISLPDPAQLVGTVSSLTNVPPGTFDTSAANPVGDSRFFAFAVDNAPPVLVIFADDPANPSATVVSDINAAAGAPVASLNGSGQLVLSGLTAVKIDSVIGNPGLGFVPGGEDFGTYNITLRYDDGTTELLTFGTQFPLAVGVGDRVEKFQQLTLAVGVFDYISLPEWWTIFGIAQINPSISTFSQEDRDIVNDVLKDFTFAVRIVADAFTRLGPVDRNIVRFFLEQIKPTISDFLFIVAEQFFDVISVTDDRNLLGASLAPSAEFVQQHGGQAPSLYLDIGLNFLRTIDWNFPNYYDLTPAARAAFEAGYSGTAYDDYVLDTEDITVVAPAELRHIDGVAGVSYTPAVINGTVATHLFDTSTDLTVRRNGATIVSVPSFPANPMRVDALIEYINAYYQTVFPGENLVSKNPDGTLHLFVDDPSTVPQLEVLVSNPGLGLALSSVFGTGSTGGVLATVTAS